MFFPAICLCVLVLGVEAARWYLRPAARRARHVQRIRRSTEAAPARASGVVADEIHDGPRSEAA